MNEKLKPTQKQVLNVLANNEDKWMGLRDIQKQCTVNSNHIESAIKFFYDNNFVYINSDGKTMITCDGLQLFNNQL